MNPYLSLILTMSIVGSSVVTGKILTLEMPIYSSSVVRFLIGSLVLIAVLFYKEGGFSRVTRLDVFLIAMLGFTGSYMFNLLILISLKTISATTVGLISGSTPVAVALIGKLFLKEKSGSGIWIGAVFAALGIALVNSAGGINGAGAEVFTIGGLLVFLSVVFEALFLVIRKWISASVSTLTIASGASVAGMFFYCPQAVVEIVGGEYIPVTMKSILLLVYYGAFITALTYIGWFYGIKKVTAVSASAITGVMPVSAVFLSFIVLGEPVGLYHVIGCIFVVTGIFFSSGVIKVPVSNKKAPA